MQSHPVYQSGIVFIYLYLHKLQPMKKLHDCRFMQAVVSKDLQGMSLSELDGAFVTFQTLLREFTTSGVGYLEIDFQLHDLHTQLSWALRKKK